MNTKNAISKKITTILFLLSWLCFNTTMAADSSGYQNSFLFQGMLTSGSNVYISGFDYTSPTGVRDASLYGFSEAFGGFGVGNLPAGSIQVDAKKGVATVNAAVYCGAISLSFNVTNEPTVIKTKEVRKEDNTKSTINIILRETLRDNAVTGTVCGLPIALTYYANIANFTTTPK